MKQSTKWFIAILGGLLFVGGMFTLLFLIAIGSLATNDTEVLSGSGEKIALVELKGTILASEDIVRQVKKYREDHSIKGILLRIDSPGGGVAASQEIYEEVRKTRDGGKPVVVSMGAVAASGGYYVSCGANRIVANPGTVTGSIGVISQFVRVDPLMKKIGVESQTIKSGKFKDAGTPFREMSADDKSYFQGLIDDIYRQFTDVVESERGLDHDSVMRYADGRVFTGEQAWALGLVDTLGTFEDAIDIAAQMAGIKGEPTLIRERHRGPSLFERLFGETKFSDLFGLKDELLNQPVFQYKMAQGF